MNPALHQEDYHENKYGGELQCISIIGNNIRFNSSSPLRILTQKSFWTVCISALLILTVLQKRTTFGVSSYGSTFAYWLCVIALYIAVYFAFLMILGYLLKYRKNNPIYICFTSLFLITLFQSTSQGELSRVFTFDRFGAELPAIMKYYVIEQVFLTLYITIARENNTKKPNTGVAHSTGNLLKHKSAGDYGTEKIYALKHNTQTTESPHLQVGMQLIDVQSIVFISAEEHHVRIKTFDGDKVIRDKLNQVIARMPAGFGHQIHRSYWVSYSEVEKIEQEDGKFSVVLTGQRGELPMSKARKKEFKRHLEGYRLIAEQARERTFE